MKFPTYAKTLVKFKNVMLTSVYFFVIFLGALVRQHPLYTLANVQSIQWKCTRKTKIRALDVYLLV
jgi:hypothetical protein